MTLVSPATPTRFVRLITLGVALVCSFGCATVPVSTPPAVAVFDPVGEYELSITDDGKPSNASMSVSGTPGTYTGVIKAQNRPDVAITTLTTSGSKVTVTGDVPQGVLLFRFEMTGETLRGDWSLRGKGGRVEGRHIKPAGRK